MLGKTNVSRKTLARFHRAKRESTSLKAGTSEVKVYPIVPDNFHTRSSIV